METPASPLFVGGPWHGRRFPVRRDAAGELPFAFCVMPPVQLTTLDFAEGPLPPLPDAITYQLRRYDYVDADGASQEPAYVYADGDLYGQGYPGASTRDVRMADHLLYELERASLPFCIAPGCDALAPMLFIADEYGRLAGRDWQPGNRIRLCHRHAHDVYRAQGVYGRDQLAEWLRPDAKLDPLDAFDAAHDLLFGDQIAEQRARMMRLQVRRG
jgi:hypothetical protein